MLVAQAGLGPEAAEIELLEREDADILGMSALLTTTMPYMKVVIDTLKEKGMREDYAEMLITARSNGYPDPLALWRRARLPPLAGPPPRPVHLRPASCAGRGSFS